MHSSLRETLETEIQTHVEDYGDLVVQNLGARHLTPPGDLPETLPIDGTLAEYDVMGEIDRYGADEAVLLAQKLRGLTVALQGTATAEANIQFEYVFGFDAERIAGRFNEDREDEYGDLADTRVTNDINNDILYHVSGPVTAGFRDTSTGTAASPEPYNVSDETNYMTEVGVLPEVSSREDLEEYFFIASRLSEDPDDVSLTIYTNWQLYWLETDDEVEGRQIDIMD